MADQDIHHPEARAAFREIGRGQWGAPLTTDFVLDETFTLLRARWGLPSVRRFADLLRRSPTVRRVPVTEAVFEASLDLMLSHAHKNWSFTDRTSFGTMRAAGVPWALTRDHNFVEAGVEIVPEA